MRLNKIKLSGFKSFVDKATLPLPSNIIGVVGPNGCGKSNIIDAVRWVMGESSPRLLRGDHMHDVIFSGSKSRKPVGLATVELFFDNSDGRAGGEYASFGEIVIKRVLSQDGQSVYWLNGTRCRKKDVVELFLGTGISPRSYAIIEQGMISRIVEAKPDELREFVEEAAGISIYKEKRKETEHKIRHTQHNLERLNDLTTEVGSQLTRLKRQASAAKRYEALKVKRLELWSTLQIIDWQTLEKAKGDIEQEITTKQNDYEKQQSRLRKIETDIEQQRLLTENAQEKFNKVQGKNYAAEANISRIEQSIEHTKKSAHTAQAEKKNAEKQLQQLYGEYQNDLDFDQVVTTDIADYEPKYQALAKELAVFQEQKEIANQQYEKWRRLWESCHAEMTNTKHKIELTRANYDNKLKHIETQKQNALLQQQEFADLSANVFVKEIEAFEKNSKTCKKELDLLTAKRDVQANVKKELEQSINNDQQELASAEKQLNDHKNELRALSLIYESELNQNSSDQDRKQLNEWLQGQNLSQQRLADVVDVESGWEKAVNVALGDRLGAILLPSLVEYVSQLEKLNLEQVICVLDDAQNHSFSDPKKLSSKFKGPKVIAEYLDHFVIANNLDDAYKLSVNLVSDLAVITQDGQIIANNWARLSNKKSDKLGLIEKKKTIEQLKQECDQLKKIVNRLTHKLNSQKEKFDLLSAEHVNIQQAYDEKSRLYYEINTKLEQLTIRNNEVAHKKTQLKQLMEHTDNYLLQEANDLKVLQQSIESLKEEYESISKQNEILQQEGNKLKENISTTNHHHQEAEDKLRSIKLLIETKKVEQKTHQIARDRLHQQIKQLEQYIIKLDEKLNDSIEPIKQFEVELKALLQQKETVEDELKVVRKELEQTQENVREQEKSRIILHNRRDEINEFLEQKRLSKQEISLKSDAIIKTLNDKNIDYQSKLDAVADADIEQCQQEIIKLDKKLHALEPINLAAVKEYNETLERKEYLEQQNQDLLKALDMLNDAIRKIDKRTRAQFSATFESINNQLEILFPKLFGGGHAYIKMTDNDVLNCGVNMLARPPGKKISNIQLLSGGEKALTAIALVFAIFQLNPAPFCLLDEVDAPLDDSNVYRFSQLVKELSTSVQMIFVTHNKITMEIAHQLVGVTMSEPGVSRFVSVDVDELVEAVN